MRQTEDMETTRICDQETSSSKLSYSIASLLRTVGQAVAVASQASTVGESVETLDHPGDKTDSTENNEESDAESDISVDSNHDVGEDDRLGGKVDDDEEDVEDAKAGDDPLLRLLPPHLLPAGLHLPHPLHGLLPPGWPPVGLLHHPSIGALNHNRTESGHYILQIFSFVSVH